MRQKVRAGGLIIALNRLNNHGVRREQRPTGMHEDKNGKFLHLDVYNPDRPLVVRRIDRHTAHITDEAGNPYTEPMPIHEAIDLLREVMA